MCSSIANHSPPYREGSGEGPQGGFFPLPRRPRANPLPLFAPGIYPRTYPAGEGIAGHAQHLAYRLGTEGVEAPAARIVGDVETRALLDDIERGTIAFQLTLTGAERPNPLAVLVVDVVPRPRRLDVADGLCLQSRCREEHEEKDEQTFHKLSIFVKSMGQR